MDAEQKAVLKQYFLTTTEELGLQKPAQEGCASQGIYFAIQFLDENKDSIVRFHGAGKKTRETIENAAAQYNLPGYGLYVDIPDNSEWVKNVFRYFSQDEMRERLEAFLDGDSDEADHFWEKIAEIQPQVVMAKVDFPDLSEEGIRAALLKAEFDDAVIGKIMSAPAFKGAFTRHAASQQTLVAVTRNLAARAHAHDKI